MQWLDCIEVEPHFDWIALGWAALRLDRTDVGWCLGAPAVDCCKGDGQALLDPRRQDSIDSLA